MARVISNFVYQVRIFLSKYFKFV